MNPSDYGMMPCRGLILAHNRRGQRFREKEVHRWLAYSVRVLNCAKVDVLAWGNIPQSVLTTVHYAREFAVPVSLRTDCAASPEILHHLAAEGLADVFLCPRTIKEDGFAAWLETCGQISIPVRVQLQLPVLGNRTAAETVEKWAECGVCSVNLVMADPFQAGHICATPQEGRDAVESCNTLVEAFGANGIEVNLFGWPPRLLRPAAQTCNTSANGFFSNYQQYDHTAYIFAKWMYASRPEVARAALLVETRRHTVGFDITDRWLMEKIFVYSPFLYRLLSYVTKSWRAHRGTRLMSVPVHDIVDCKLPANTFSDAEIRQGIQMLGGYDIEAADHECKESVPRVRYVDPVDRDRLHRASLWQDLAREAYDWQRTEAPARVLDMKEWGTEEAFMVPEYGGTAWLTFTSGERISTVFDDLEPPYCITVTAGGGIAEAVGFQLGNSFKIMCPLVESRHTVSLYVREDRRYVLLRDGAPIAPIQRPGEYAPSHSAPSIAKTRLVTWDIDGRISFSPLKIWKGARPSRQEAVSPRYSVVIFCTRFARRLAAVLNCLAHQHDFDPALLEVIVGYVPGMDATEDVLKSVQLVHKNLRIVHSTFPIQNARSKGYVLNQCMAMASGEWIMLLDADTLVPPFMFHRLQEVEREQKFVFPKGRAMLDSETTAAILLGDVKPWENWNVLVQHASELRMEEALGAPIGYCQCFRRTCLDTIRYQEYEHFQGADYEFALALRQHFGAEYRFDFPVLHLDHEGSQWFGAERHF